MDFPIGSACRGDHYRACAGISTGQGLLPGLPLFSRPKLPAPFLVQSFNWEMEQDNGKEDGHASIENGASMRTRKTLLKC